MGINIKQFKLCSKPSTTHHLNPVSVLLTVELQDWVVDFALHLACALERTGHPQSFIHGHRCDDVVPNISRHLPLRHNCANYQSNYTQKGQGESQKLQTFVGHFHHATSASTTSRRINKDDVHLLWRYKSPTNLTIGRVLAMFALLLRKVSVSYFLFASSLAFWKQISRQRWCFSL